MRTTVRELLEESPTISVGILTADLLNLGEELSILKQAGAHVVHIDVMDGRFCPQFTFGPPIVRAIPDRFIRDCHIMIEEPLEQIQSFVDAGADIVTCHVESTRHPHRLLQSLAGSGVLRGIALNPGTPLSAVEPLLDDLELLLLLAINPGWGGQRFLPGTESRIIRAREMIAERDVVLAIDGGVNRANIEHIATLGVDIIVSGSAIYDGVSSLENLRYLLSNVRNGSRDTPQPKMYRNGGNHHARK